MSHDRFYDKSFFRHFTIVYFLSLSFLILVLLFVPRGVLRQCLLFGSIAGMLIGGAHFFYRVKKRFERLFDRLEVISLDTSDRPIKARGDDEVNFIAEAVTEIGEALRSRIHEAEQEKAKFRGVLDNMTEGVIALDAKKDIIFINDAACQLFGIEREACGGRSLIEMVKHTRIDDMADSVLMGGKTNVCLIELHYGHKKTIRMNAVELQSERSEVKVILVFSDMTEIKRLENLRKEFVANASHELKTPLTSIKGFVETLLGGAYKDPEQTKKFLKIMEEDSNRLGRLVEDLLDLSKLESKSETAEKAAQSFCILNSELVKVLDSLQPLIEKKNIQVENRIASQRLPEVRIHSDQLRQIWLNLLDNAVKFNREGGSIIIDAQKEGDRITCLVKDTGVGIPEKFLNRVFERFFRVDPARSRQEGGTGLGLAIVRHIIESAGGAVRCESIPGIGSTFQFSLLT